MPVPRAAAQPAAHADPPLAYRACPQDDCAIFVRDPDGGERRLTANDGDHGPAWSPDGREIAFVGQDVGLFAIGADGADERQVWSPDGRWVAFRRGEGGTGDLSELAVVPADGSEGRVLLDGMTGFGFAWAPDGQRLAAVLNTPGAEPDHLGLLRAAGGGALDHLLGVHDEVGVRVRGLITPWSPTTTAIGAPVRSLRHDHRWGNPVVFAPGKVRHRAVVIDASTVPAHLCAQGRLSPHPDPQQEGSLGLITGQTQAALLALCP